MGGKPGGFETGAGGQTVEDGRARNFLVPTEGHDQQHGHQHPRQQDGRGIEEPFERLLAERAADGPDDAIGQQARAMIERGGGETLALGFRQIAEAAGDRPAHPDTMQAGGEPEAERGERGQRE